MSFFAEFAPSARRCSFRCDNPGLAALCTSRTFAQQATAPATTPTPANKADAADFDAASDEVLAQIERNHGAGAAQPAQKKPAFREQIRAHIIKEMNDDKDAAERYAGARSAEAFACFLKGLTSIHL